MAAITSLLLGDPPGLWRDLGFSVADDGACDVDGVLHRLGSTGAGVTAWSLDEVTGLSELAEVPGPPDLARGVPQHPNGVRFLDHVVVSTPDLGRTTGAFEGCGVRLRRIRDIGPPERPLRQAFFRLGAVVVEVVGPVAPSGDGPATFWGLAFTVADLDGTAAWLGDRLGPVTGAVQPGRRIATLRRAAGSTVPIAFMTPAPS